MKSETSEKNYSSLPECASENYFLKLGEGFRQIWKF